MRPLLDTNVISELMRRQPDPSVEKWAAAQTGFHLSVITVEEIEYATSQGIDVVEVGDSGEGQDCDVDPALSSRAFCAAWVTASFELNDPLTEASWYTPRIALATLSADSYCSGMIACCKISTNGLRAASWKSSIRFMPDLLGCPFCQLSEKRNPSNTDVPLDREAPHFTIP